MNVVQRCLCSLVLVVLGIAFARDPAAGQVLSAKATGPVIVAQYDLEGKRSAWIGCSAILADGTEYDLPAMRVSDRGTKAFAIPAHIARSCVEYVCALWAQKVRDRTNKMGYHLEGRLAVFRDAYPGLNIITWREQKGLIHLFLNGNHAFSYDRTRRDSAVDREELALRALAAAEEFLGLAISLAGALPGTGAVPPIHQWIGRDETTAQDYSLYFRLHWQDQILVGLEAYGPITRQIGRDLRRMGFGGKSGQYIYQF